jgi:hypothetical protein
MWQVVAPRPLGVEFARQVIKIEGDPVGLVGSGGGLDDARVKGDALDQRMAVGALTPSRLSPDASTATTP